MEEYPNNNNNESQSKGQQKGNGTGGSNSSSRNSGSNGPHIEPPITTTTTTLKSNLIKSNLKRSTTVEEINQSRTDKRKVSWPDAHGKDIAHVREFEPSLSEDGELEGVRNSCICTIQ